MRGDDNPNTLISAAHLAVDLRELGEVQAARDLDQDTLNPSRRVLGENHPPCSAAPVAHGNTAPAGLNRVISGL